MVPVIENNNFFFQLSGVSSLRLASDGTELPNASEALYVVISNYGRDDYDNVTLALMSFGQFVTHDLALSEDFTFGNY